MSSANRVCRAPDINQYGGVHRSDSGASLKPRKEEGIIILTLARKLEAVHRTTTISNRAIPSVLLAKPPRAKPFCVLSPCLISGISDLRGDSEFSLLPSETGKDESLRGREDEAFATIVAVSEIRCLWLAGGADSFLSGQEEEVNGSLLVQSPEHVTGMAWFRHPAVSVGHQKTKRTDIKNSTTPGGRFSFVFVKP